jgi:protein TonB
MSYQALLFCADERLARVVTQVFTELEFSVEAVNEPFSAVKKLMAQHYDAVVVDCENEQNASLLFKSARNSSANQSSLALALVEGQAGVAKAYRIGANLVLTKPINVEQAKGTLRVARGLLRKNADAAATTTSGVPPTLTPGSAPKPEVAKPAALTVQPAKPAKTAFTFQTEKSSEFANTAAPAKPDFAMPEFEPAMPAMAASMATEKATPPAPEPVITSAVQPPWKAEPAPLPNSKPVVTPINTAKPAGFGTFQSAAAPAPAKDVVPPAKEKARESELFEKSIAKSQAEELIAPPTFSALGAHDSEGSGGPAKFIAIAAAVVLVGVLGYFGWTKFGKSSAVSSPQTAIQNPQLVQAPANPAPSSAETEPVQAAPVASSPAPTTASKPKPTISSVPVTKIPAGKEEAPEVVTKTFAPPPMRVKADSSMPKAQTPKVHSPTDDSAAIPSPLAVGSSNDNSLASVVSGPATLPVAPVGALKISQGVSQGLLIKKVQPEYPQNARAMRIEGAVQMQALIDKEGKITNVKVMKGHPVLARAAVDAVRQWRYKPYYLDGQPVEIQTEITVVFKLPN